MVEKNKRLGVAWSVDIRDAAGNPFEKTDGENSILTNWLSLLYGLFDAPINMNNTSGTSVSACIATGPDTTYGHSNHSDHSDSKSYRYEYGGLDCAAPAGTTSYGIVVGTGTGAVTAADYSLGSMIAHGTGTGQLSYGAGSVGGLSVGASRAEVSITRLFTNNTAASITINEIGLYTRCTNGATVTHYICVFRDLIGGITVPAGGTATVTYTYYTTV